MKRFHLHLAVEDLAQNVRFYSQLFGMEPTVIKPDYAQWMLDDPRINFAISTRGTRPGLDHLGIQVDDDTELEEMHTRLAAANAASIEREDVACCYARSNKYWVQDPQGIAWEAYHTLAAIPVFGRAKEHSGVKSQGVAAVCCAPSGKAERGEEQPPAATTCCG